MEIGKQKNKKNRVLHSDNFMNPNRKQWPGRKEKSNHQWERHPQKMVTPCLYGTFHFLCHEINIQELRQTMISMKTMTTSMKTKILHLEMDLKAQECWSSHRILHVTNHTGAYSALSSQDGYEEGWQMKVAYRISPSAKVRSYLFQ